MNVRRTVRERSPQVVPLARTVVGHFDEATVPGVTAMSTEMQQSELDEIETDARRAIVRTLNRDPYDVWTRDSLARSLGISSGLAGKLLLQLASAGMVHRLDGLDDEYTVAGDGDRDI